MPDWVCLTGLPGPVTLSEIGFRLKLARGSIYCLNWWFWKCQKNSFMPKKKNGNTEVYNLTLCSNVAQMKAYISLQLWHNLKALDERMTSHHIYVIEMSKGNFCLFTTLLFWNLLKWQAGFIPSTWAPGISCTLLGKLYNIQLILSSLFLYCTAVLSALPIAWMEIQQHSMEHKSAWQLRFVRLLR